MLYLSPVVPAVTGNGLAMRSGAILRALSRHYRITLLVAPLYAPRHASLPPQLAACCERIFRFGEQPALAAERFEIVHVFRLAGLPFAAPWLPQAAMRQLDLDDVESVSRRDIAALLARSGDAAGARREAAAARQAWERENAVLAEFDRVFVAAESDRQTLQARGQADVVVLPNSLPLPETTPLPPPANEPFTLLFVGTLGYAPNADAARVFCTEILPRIQDGAERPVVARIVGGGATPAVRRLGALPGVEVVGAVADIAPCYRDAHVAIVPLRAGGGTRIKALEAFARGRPLVTTTIGIAGIAAEHGRHALIADDPAAFAAACLRLLHEPGLGARLAREAFALFCRDYTEERLERAIAALTPPPPRPARPAGAAPRVPR
jgi:glycosyltransferase involved in cell wall biosynthesis